MGMHFKLVIMVVALQLLPGCSAPATEKSSLSSMPELPSQWRQAALTSSDPVSAQWWLQFNNDELNGLIERAHQQSPDIALSLARIRQAGASAHIAGAAQWPAVTVTLSRDRREFVDDNRLTTNNWNAGLSAGYELDLWGRVRAQKQGALQLLQASRYDRDAIRLTVTAAVARQWIERVKLQEQLTIARLNRDNAGELLQLVAARYRSGAVSELDYVQQRGTLATLERRVESLQQQYHQAGTVLAVLLGETASLETTTHSLTEVILPVVQVDVPAALLARRPDIARAEAELVAAKADIAVARSAMLPTLNLSAGIAGSNDRFSGLFDNTLYNLAAGLSAPVFQGGRLRAGYELAGAKHEAVLIQYHKAIIDAIADVQQALDAVDGSAIQQRMQLTELQQAERALVIAESRYRSGAGSLMDLLHAQQNVYSARANASELKAEQLQAGISLYKALGGGWNTPASAQAISAR